MGPTMKSKAAKEYSGTRKNAAMASAIWPHECSEHNFATLLSLP